MHFIKKEIRKGVHHVKSLDAGSDEECDLVTQGIDVATKCRSALGAFTKNKPKLFTLEHTEDTSLHLHMLLKWYIVKQGIFLIILNKITQQQRKKKKT